MHVCAIYISPAHNYFGHHEQPAGTAPVISLTEAELVAHHGIRGDRFFGWKENYKGQITFFAEEVFADLCAALEVTDRAAAVLRRNVVTRGVDLNSLIGREFTVQGIRFMGTTECSPCYWMDQAFHPGAEAALKGRGGLRARILTDGILRCDAVKPPHDKPPIPIH
jgi:MOSC domain-containing protein YiiM